MSSVNSSVNGRMMDTLCIGADKSKFIVYGIMFVSLIIVVENILGITVICKSPHLRTTTTFIFIRSLAMTDLLVGVSYFGVMVLDETSNLIPRQVYEGFQTWCMVQSAVMVMVSVLHMAVIAVERYLFIKMPFKHERYVTPKLINLALAILWIIAVLSCAIPAIITMAKGDRICATIQMPVALIVHVEAPIIILCTIITCVAYFQITIFAFNINQVRPADGIGNAVIYNLGSSPCNINQINPLFKSSQRVGSDVIRSVKFFVVVFGVFFITTSPAMIMAVMQFYVDVPINLLSLFFLILELNSAMNFIILIIIQPLFRKALIEFFCRGQTIGIS